MGLIKDITGIGLSFAVLKMVKEGTKLKNKDDNTTGKDDIAGGALVTGAMLVNELSDGGSGKEIAVAEALEEFAAQLRAEHASKQK